VRNWRTGGRNRSYYGKIQTNVTIVKILLCSKLSFLSQFSGLGNKKIDIPMISQKFLVL
jgi:hypothetical protein